MIRRSYRLYYQDKITYEKTKDKAFFWLTILAKWVNGECHHLCFCCAFKDECWGNAKEK